MSVNRTCVRSGLLVVTAALSGLLTSCGGGGAGGSGAPPFVGFASAEVIYRPGQAVEPDAPIIQGTSASGWTVDPALPAGLVLDPESGAVSGTPATETPRTEHKFTATTPEGPLVLTRGIQIRSPDALSLAPMPGLNTREIRHLLERTSFAYTDRARDDLARQGLEAFLLDMTTLTPQRGVESTAARAYLRTGDDPDGRFPSERDLARWWMYMILNNPRPFQEVLALHWHDHFATSSDVLNSSSRWWFVDHVNLWRYEGAGNLRTLLIDMARDWSMLEWLDGIRNDGGPGEEPNENFAREFFELFCLGVDNGYTEADIKEAARAFSGYRRLFDGERNYVAFDPDRHDPGPKTIFGQVIPGQGTTDDYEAVIDVTLGLTQPGTNRSRTARWITRSILERFCRPDPPDALIDGLADVLQSNGWDLQVMLVTLFRSEAFYADASLEALVKSPVEEIASFVRATGLQADAASIESRLSSIGQRPTQPPGVQGWPEGTEWLSAQAMIERANLVRYVISSRTWQADRGITLDPVLPPAPYTPADLVDGFAGRLGVPLTSIERDECIQYLNSAAVSGGGSTPSPFDPDDPRHIDERARGLLYVLSQHPLFHTR